MRSSEQHRKAPAGPGGGGAPTWHAGPALLAAYASGRCGPVDAWSAEGHLTTCAMCRAELAIFLPEEEGAALAHGLQRLLAELPAQAPGPHSTAFRRPRHRPWVVLRHSRLVMPPAALLAVLVAVVLAVGVDALARWAAGYGSVLTPDAGAGVGAGGAGSRGGLLWLLAPALPLAGVSLCSVASADPWREAVLATPSAGWRLVLWRTAVVVAAAVPLTAAAGVLAGTAAPALWLLPCLALTCMALALGTVMDLQRAAQLLGGLWVLVVLGPPAVAASGDARGPLHQVIDGAQHAPVLLEGSAQGVWAAAAVVAAAVLVWRRGTYEQLSRAAGRSTA